MFPQDEYTPFGYLDNPFHTWKSNRSGVIRVDPPCGFGWLFPNAQTTIYRASLNIGLQFGDQRILTPADFQHNSIPFHCNYHSKNLFRFNWQWQKINIAAEFFLADENVLAAMVAVNLLDVMDVDLSLLLVQSVNLVYQKTGLWDFGLTGRYDEIENAMIIKSFAEGYCFTLKPSQPPDGFGFSDELAALNMQPVESTPAKNMFSSTTNDSLFGIINLPVKTGEKRSFKVSCLLSRGASEHKSKHLIVTSFPNLDAIRSKKLTDDQQFWQTCPKLEGDWQGHWKRGWVYDWETLRMNIRKPAGIFSTHWDAMQIQKPRVVLAETSLDMLMMSYAKPALCREVIAGLFKNAPGTQVPCCREDGSLNMIAEDGSECGTSPAWCFPFYCFESIFLRDPDREWLGELVPHLENYLNWWLSNRTDVDGWAVYKCSWESGQDDSIKFLIDQPTGGETVEHLRAVDLQAAMAQSAEILNFFAACLNRTANDWDEVYQDFRDRTRSMWHMNRFCDFDKRTGKWVQKAGYFDITNLAPFFAGIYTENQLKQSVKWFEHFKNNPRYWLDWASFFFMFIEACWNVGLKKLAAEIIYSTIDRVHKNWDSRTWQEGEAMPGVSVECWGREKPFGAEGYGWAATLQLHIIRSLIGFREYKPDFENSFLICPNLPDELLIPGNTYAMSGLKFQDKIFSINYEILKNRELFCHFSCLSEKKIGLSVLDSNEQVISRAEAEAAHHRIQIKMKNRESYRFVFRKWLE